jgi:hypothetical protein
MNGSEQPGVRSDSARAGTGRSGRLGRRRWRSLAALCLTLGGLGLWSAPALATIHRGHAFDSSVEGVGEHKLKEPSDVAVNESTGEMYVVDGGDERVVGFKRNGKGDYEFASEFKVDSPGAIAVDNATSSSDPSRGDVYVAGSKEPGAEAAERDYIYKFTPSGERLLKKSDFKVKATGEEFEVALEDISGLAVDRSGTVLTYWEEGGDVSGFSDEATNKLVPALSKELEVVSKFGCPARPAFAVAPGDEAFYVGYERESASEECPGEQGESPDALAVAKLGGTGNTLSQELARQSTTGVAVDPASGDVYLDNVTSVAALTSSGLLIQRFGSEHLSGGSGIAVDSASDIVFVPESHEGKVDVFTPEEPGPPVVDSVSSQALTPSSTELSAQIDPRGAETQYYFQYGTVDCVTSSSSCADAPVPVGKISAGFGDQPVSVEIAGLQPATAYYYRVLANSLLGGPVEGLASPNTFTTLPSPTVLPDGRAWEMVSPPEKHGGAIEALPRGNKGGVIQASANGNAIAWLATAPVVGEPEGNRSFELSQLMSIRGSEEWQTRSLETPHHNGAGLLNPSPTQYHYFSPDLSLSLVQPTEPSLKVGGVLEEPPLASEASEKTMYIRDDPPINPEPSDQQIYGEAKGNSDYLPPGYLPLVTAANDSAATKFGGALEFLDATRDLSHVVFESKVALTSTNPAPGLYEWEAGAPLKLLSVLPEGTPASEWFLGNGEGQNATGGLNTRDAISSDGTRVFFTAGEGKEHLYMRDTARGETIQVNAAQGNDATEPGEGKQVVDEPEAEHQEVHFQSASSDGSKVFFTDTARLTEDSTLEPVGGEAGPADLYELELTSASGEPLRGRLVDLTAEPTQGSADVLNLIPGASEDGSRVYFVANGVLAPGATPGHCDRYAEEEPPPPSSTCNLYMSAPDPEHPGRHETKFIAALSSEDGGDWGAGLSRELIPQGNLSSLTSRVSPDGRYLTFMSDRSLTGYQNEDVTSGHPGERLDEEVFLYDSTSNRLVCASCNPNGEGSGWKRPHGVFDTELAGEGLGLLVDRPEIWSNRWLAGSIPGWTFNITNAAPSALYQTRYLSDSGRLFFDSADALVAQDTNGKQDVYEYEPDGVGSCQRTGGCVGLISSGTSDHESVFLDASENGDDVFFLTSAKLVAQDHDEAFDIYDARVCSESSPCLTSLAASSRPCEASATCRPAQPPQPQSVSPPASTTLSAAENAAGQGILPSKTPVKPKPLTRAQKLAITLSGCRKHDKHNKKKRVTCERQARKRYAPAANAKSRHRTTRRTTRAAAPGGTST